MPELATMDPPDKAQRKQALDTSVSVIVQAPAGSGKTQLLTSRFLRLLAEVDDPSQVVAITFTRAAAAEMRNRILEALEKAEAVSPDPGADEFSLESLAVRALARSRRLGWNLMELSSQLRIYTIDSFCREIASRQPLLSTLGGGLRISENPTELYRRAARATLLELGSDAANPELRTAIEVLLDWRDNGWSEIEDRLVDMLRSRDRWMQDFLLSREKDWDLLRAQLERPLARAAAASLQRLAQLLTAQPGACAEILDLARFACAQSGNNLYRELAEIAEMPAHPFVSAEEIEDARQVFLCLAGLLLTNDGNFRRSYNVSLGFPPHLKSEKQRISALSQMLAGVPGLEDALAEIRKLPPARYTDDEWRIVRASFTLLHYAAAQLRVVFAEVGVCDFIEVAQAAQLVLQDQNRQPTDAGLAIADGIRHLLVDEFQDTSRRQHQLISALVHAWPDPAGRTLFVVGDPMQSIYFFRNADAELFPRVQSTGIELPDGEQHALRDVRLSANFRTAPALVDALNEMFRAAFVEEDGSGIQFGASEPARRAPALGSASIDLHVEFVPQLPRTRAGDSDSAEMKRRASEERDARAEAQTAEIVALIQHHLPRAEQARLRREKYRIAVLARTGASLARIAQALRQAGVSFRAIDLEPLAMRPEVLDAIALSRALYSPEDRVAWLGILRAPWCGLSLADLHALAGDGDSAPIPFLLRERMHRLSPEAGIAVARLLAALDAAPALRSSLPASALGTWIEQVWLALGGAACVDVQARGNLDMLWRSLDALPNGEPDLLGSGLSIALEKLSAQADPDAASDTGVQLMTIHKSKGLEFEVVIVPDLHARSGQTEQKILSWLERGLPQPDESGEITEFLIAPIQPKGADKGDAKGWVDWEYRNRERQEMRRVFYVAATRAREELHLFARAEFNNATGELCNPPESLLRVAWPALEQTIRDRYDVWQAEQEEPEVPAIAASGNNVVTMESSKHAIVRRLPLDYQAPRQAALASTLPRISLNAAALFARHEGGMESRVLGVVVHAFLEELARLRVSGSWDDARAALPAVLPRAAARARSAGMDRIAAEQIAQQALDIALRASHDSHCQWILSPHADAASEARWTGIFAGAIHTVQVDRVFRAGATPQAEGTDTWWIIDYKSAHAEGIEPVEALPRLRPLFAPQLEIYAEVLRGLHGREISIRAGLYYPRLLAFDFWEI